MDSSSPSSVEFTNSVSLMTPSRKFAIASQLISQLADLVEGPPEMFAARIAVLQDIREAWTAGKEVIVATQSRPDKRIWKLPTKGKHVYELHVADDAMQTSSESSAGCTQSSLNATSEDREDRTEESANFQAVGLRTPLNVLIKQEADIPGMPKIDSVMGPWHDHPGTVGGTVLALPQEREMSSPFTGSQETEITPTVEPTTLRQDSPNEDSAVTGQSSESYLQEMSQKEENIMLLNQVKYLEKRVQTLQETCTKDCDGLVHYQDENCNNAPRPGKVNADIATKHQMVELSQGTGIFVYPLHIMSALRRSSSGTKMACSLLNSFFTNEELSHMGTLKGVPKTILDAIVDFILTNTSDKTTTEASVKQALRTKVSGLKFRATKKLTPNRKLRNFPCSTFS